MRNNNLKDLYVDYPFLPVASAPSWFKSVKYMRVTVTLPAGQPADQGKNGAFISAQLTALSSTTATVHVVCSAYAYDQSLVIPVFTGGIPYGNSYLYTDTELPTLTGLSYQIHPDCLVFQQIAPVLRMEVHTGGSNPSMQLKYMGEHDISQWLQADWIERKLIDDVLWLANGHNVEVSGSSDTVIFTGTPGAGKGMWDTPPYTTTDSSFNGHRGIGLRSINGKTGQVYIQGDRSVEVHKAEGSNTLVISPVFEV